MYSGTVSQDTNKFDSISLHDVSVGLHDVSCSGTGLHDVSVGLHDVSVGLKYTPMACTMCPTCTVLELGLLNGQQNQKMGGIQFLRHNRIPPIFCSGCPLRRHSPRCRTCSGPRLDAIRVPREDRIAFFASPLSFCFFFFLTFFSSASCFFSFSLSRLFFFFIFFSSFFFCASPWDAVTSTRVSQGREDPSAHLAFALLWKQTNTCSV